MLHVIDNVLDEDNRLAVHNYFVSLGGSTKPTWVEGDFNQFVNYGSPLSNLLVAASQFVGLNKMVGCEYWSHLNTRPGWHKDTDEALYFGKQIEKFPICSCVYYPSIVDLQGGELIFETMKIFPVTNRLVIFDPSLLHTVGEFVGNRLSVAVNPWGQKLEGEW